MKSLLISTMYFPPQVGGISQIMANTARALGPERVCCLTGVRGSGEVMGQALVARTYRFPTAFFGRTRLGRALVWSRAVGEIVLRERPDAVLLATADEGYLGCRLRRWLRMPYLVYAHGNEILHLLQGKDNGSGAALRCASRVLANSRYTASMLDELGVDSRRVEIVHPGCDVRRFRPLAPSPELRRKLLGPRWQDRVILTTGNLVTRKGHDMVLRALAQMYARMPDVTYLVVGEGPSRGALEALAQSLGVRDRIVFAGQLPDEDLPGVYALADVFVMPSRDQRNDNDVEGFGIVFLEAAACGKPAIGGLSGGTPEAVLDGVTGLLVDPEAPNEIGDAIERMLTDQSLAARLGEAARVRVVREFDWGRIAERVWGIVESAVREGVP